MLMLRKGGIFCGLAEPKGGLEKSSTSRGEVTPMLTYNLCILILNFEMLIVMIVTADKNAKK